MSGTATTGTGPKPPMALLAELTHRCPVACPYCSNPTELTGREAELTAGQWADVFAQAAALGVLQVHISGGEPASRRDLVEIVRAAAAAGLYTNLITSGVGLTAQRLAALDAAAWQGRTWPSGVTLRPTEPQPPMQAFGYLAW